MRTRLLFKTTRSCSTCFPLLLLVLVLPLQLVALRRVVSVGRLVRASGSEAASLINDVGLRDQVRLGFCVLLSLRILCFIADRQHSLKHRQSSKDFVRRRLPSLRAVTSRRWGADGKTTRGDAGNGHEREYEHQPPQLFFLLPACWYFDSHTAVTASTSKPGRILAL